MDRLWVNLTDARMIFLQGFHRILSLAVGRNPPGCRKGSGERRDIGNFIFDGSLSDVGVVVLAQLAARGVDDKLNFLILDPIDNVGSSLMHLKDMFRLDAVLSQESMGPSGGFDFETEAIELAGHLEYSGSISL